MPVVTKDATSGTWFPASASEFTSLLSGTGLANPTNLWLSQEASGNLADSIGTQTLTAGAVSAYAEAIPGLSRLGYRLSTSGTQTFSSTAGPIGTGTDSQMVLAFVQPTGAQVVDRDIIGIQGGSGYRGAQLSAADKFKYNVNDGSAAATGTATPGTTFHPVLLQIDRTNAANRVVTDQEFITQTPNTTPANVAANFFVGAAIAAGGALARVAYKAGWHGAGAELTTTQISVLLDRFANGPGISSIAISPTTATLALAATQSMVATSTRVDTSTVVNTSQVIWSSSNPAIATVNAAGLITAVAGGTANITATFTSFGGTLATSNTAVITVSGGVTLSTIAVTPAVPTVFVNGTQQLLATGTYSDASTANLTSIATWSSLTPSVATVSATGLVTAIAIGTAVVRAVSGAITGSATVTAVAGVPLPIIGTDVPDHIAQALARLPEQDKNKPLIAALLSSFVSPAQDLESALWQLLTQRFAATAIGSNLDAIGKLVGQPRNGLADVDYRTYVYARISANRSSGLAEDLLRVAKLIINNAAAVITLSYGGAGTVIMRVTGVTQTDAQGAALAAFVQAAIAAGIRVLVIYSLVIAAQTFRYDVGPGYDVGHFATGIG